MSSTHIRGLYWIGVKRDRTKTLRDWAVLQLLQVGVVVAGPALNVQHVVDCAGFRAM